MPSSDFVPLASGSDAPAFRPLGTPGPDPSVVSAEAPAPAPGPSAPERVEETAAWHAGFEAGREAAQVDVQAMAETFARSLEQLATFQKNLRVRYERELLLVALGVARKVVQHELQERPDIWMAMIRSAITQAVDRERIVVRVPPQLASFLAGRGDALREGLDEVRELQVVADPALPPGGCIVESRWGDVDIGVDTQLEAAERALVRAER
jgi:flagellar assembly protein FliH